MSSSVFTFCQYYVYLCQYCVYLFQYCVYIHQYCVYLRQYCVFLCQYRVYLYHLLYLNLLLGNALTHMSYSSQQQLAEKFNILIGCHRQRSPDSRDEQKGLRSSRKTVFRHPIRMLNFSINSIPMKGMDKKLVTKLETKFLYCGSTNRPWVRNSFEGTSKTFKIFTV